MTDEQVGAGPPQRPGERARVRAVRLTAASPALGQDNPATLILARRAGPGVGLGRARSALGDVEYPAAWVEGQAMTFDGAIACALDGDGG